jgi:hypothetical protein
MGTRGRILWTAAAAAAAIVLMLALRTGDFPSQPESDGARVAGGDAGLRGRERIGSSEVEKTDPRRMPEPEGLSVEGEVVDEAGSAVEGARVRLGSREVLTRPSGAFAVTVADPRGSPDLGTLVARKSGYASGQLTVTSTRLRGLQIVLGRPCTIQGRVMGEGGPIEGAQVTLEEGGARTNQVTDREGRFAFFEARSSACDLVATAPDFNAVRAGLSPGVSPRTAVLWLQAEPSVLLRITDAAGAPVEGADVTIERSTGRASVATKSDKAGLAGRLPTFSNGVVIKVTAEGYLPRGVRDLPRVLSEDFTVALQREHILMVRLAGVEPGEFGSWLVAGGSRRGVDASSWTGFDHDGVARIPGVHPGFAYAIVAVRRDGHGHQVSTRRVIWASDKVPPDPPAVTWTPPALARLQIDTADPQDGGPASAEITVRWASRKSEDAAEVVDMSPDDIRLASDPSGSTSVWLWPGKYDVHVVRGPSGRAKAQVDVPAAGTRVKLLVPRGHELSGVVATSAGVRLPGRWVGIREVRGGGAQSRKSDDRGRFAFEGLSAGRHELRFDGVNGESFANGPVWVDAPSTDVTLTAVTCAVSGVIEPRPPEPVAVAMRFGRESPWVLGEVDDQGRFAFTDLAPGDWTVQVLKARVPWGPQALFEEAVSVSAGALLRVRGR